VPRGNSTFNTEAGKDQVSPVTLVRILDMPEVADAAKVHSLYLADSRDDITWFDESGNPVTYFACGLGYTDVKVSTDTPVGSATLRLDNVDRRFSALAQYVDIVDAEVHVFRGLANLLDTKDGAQLLFVGHLDSPVIADGGDTSTIECTLKADFSLQVEIPRRNFWVNLFPYLPAAKDVRKIPV